MDVLDLFRGAGGWSVACQRLGLTDWGVEIMREANLTADLAGHKTAYEDVWDAQRIPTYTEGLIASPPCQTFSQAGKGNGRKALDTVLAAIAAGSYRHVEELRSLGESVGDERTSLVLAPLLYAHTIRPEWIAFEQVPTVLPVWEACAEVIRSWGYSAWTGNLQAEQYGVPQTRKRAFLIASRTREVGAPTPTHSRYYPRTPDKLDEGVEKWVSMAEALGWADEGHMRSNYGTGGDPSKRGERLLSQPAPTVTSKIDRNKWVYRNNTMANQAERSLDQPAPTLAFGHEVPRWVLRNNSSATAAERTDSVRVTVQEAGVLQSFPADYPWQGAKGKQYLQVGNAVPPLLAEAVIREAAGL